MGGNKLFLGSSYDGYIFKKLKDLKIESTSHD